MNTSIPLENQLLATKFYVPVASGPLISRPRLTVLLNESLKCPFTLVSAPAGFGKTTLLSAWVQSRSPSSPLVAWVSLDEEDNEPRLFWTYVLTALNMQQPERFTPLLMQLQSPQAPPLKYVLAVLINLLAEGTDEFVLILDDYQMITEQEMHTTLAYVIEHLPAQLRIILATRADPPLPIPLLRARYRALEVRTDQLRCTLEETRAFFQEVIGIGLADETIDLVTARTEGWLVGLQLLGLSLAEQTNPATLLKEISGDQRYILAYLTEVVLQRQPPEVQTFLLSTAILERLTAPLCDAIMQQTGSQHLLQRLEQANLFVVSLDSKREWYRYHALFAEALRYQLEQTQPDLTLILHHRASLWYAEHNQTTQAILHALHAKAWDLVADLIEQMSSQLSGLAWGISLHQLAVLHQWLKQLPPEIVGSRPLLCYACTEMLWTVASYPMQQVWLNTAEATLTASLTAHVHGDASSIHAPEGQQEQRNLLGSLISFRAVLQSYRADGEKALPLCQQALSLVSADHVEARIHAAVAQTWAYYASAANDASAAVKSGLQAVAVAQTAGQPTLVIGMMSVTAVQLLGMGRLNEAQQLAQQAIGLGKQPEKRELPHVSLPAFFQAEVLREWNQLDAALSLIEEAISLGEQVESFASLASLLDGYGVLLRVHLSRGELDAACSAFQKAEDLGRSMEHSLYLLMYCYFTMIDQVRLWLACGQLDRAMDWAEQVEIEERHGTPLTRERVGVARARIFLAKDQPALALQRLEPALQRATEGQRWGHVIEIRLLQALAYQMLQQETQALSALSEAVRLGEPEGYIRSFVDEGAAMEPLLYQLRKQNDEHGPTPYLDTLLAAFQQRGMAHAQVEEPKQAQALPEPLSERELQVLQLLARGASNQEIAQELVIVVDTVKRHVSHIFSKLDVQNRVQAVIQARERGLLDEES
jgi:LuxR family maltose regulon positive regulatory protein